MRTVFLILLGVLYTAALHAVTDTLRNTHFNDTNRYPVIHRIGFDLRPAYLVPTNRFLRGENEKGKPINQAFSAHLKYAFQFHPDSYEGRMFPGTYQGIGISYNTFGEPHQLGNPVAVYLFQGSPIVRFSPKLSLNYEWNFGIACGWKPYDYDTNPYNRVIGSKVNAYLNTNFYLDYQFAREWKLAAGIDFTHYSNGNTSFPNAGVNTIGARIGIIRTFTPGSVYEAPHTLSPLPAFQRHFSYDLIFFGSWRRKGIILEDRGIASPEKYPVLGFNFAPMYNFHPRFRGGISLDGIYDSSASAYVKEDGTNENGEPNLIVLSPPRRYQYALGLSARAELVMPYFSVNIGIGANALYRSHDFKGCYQVLALKFSVTRNTFLHIGYNLQNFQNPNYLMLGIGYRFNNKRFIR